MLEIYIKRTFFREGLEFFFFQINMKKMKNQATNEIFRQMTMTLTLFQNVIYVQWKLKFFFFFIYLFIYLFFFFFFCQLLKLSPCSRVKSVHIYLREGVNTAVISDMNL